MKKWLFLFPLILLACADKIQPPINLISESEMINILADMHVADAMVELKRIEKTSEMFSYKNTYFQEILVKHNLTQEAFDASYKYYAADLNKYNELYDSVLVTLSKREAEL